MLVNEIQRQNFPLSIGAHDPSSRYTMERDKLNLSEAAAQSGTSEAQNFVFL